MTVVACAGCERFVRASESECPFCGTGRNALPITLKRPNMARAAIVALALAGGCSSAAPVYGGPPPETPPTEPEQDSTDEGSTEEGSTDEPESEAEPQVEVEQTPPRPAYGGPPPEGEYE
ncbi:MAG: hypothetical protein AB8H86_14800 [Polyangiales bacterium]